MPGSSALRDHWGEEGRGPELSGRVRQVETAHRYQWGAVTSSRCSRSVVDGEGVDREAQKYPQADLQPAGTLRVGPLRWRILGFGHQLYLGHHWFGGVLKLEPRSPEDLLLDSYTSVYWGKPWKGKGKEGIGKNSAGRSDIPWKGKGKEGIGKNSAGRSEEERSGKGG